MAGKSFQELAHERLHWNAQRNQLMAEIKVLEGKLGEADDGCYQLQERIRKAESEMATAESHKAQQRETIRRIEAELKEAQEGIVEEKRRQEKKKDQRSEEAHRLREELELVRPPHHHHHHLPRRESIMDPGRLEKLLETARADALLLRERSQVLEADLAAEQKHMARVLKQVHEESELWRHRFDETKQKERKLQHELQAREAADLTIARVLSREPPPDGFLNEEELKDHPTERRSVLSMKERHAVFSERRRGSLGAIYIARGSFVK